MAPCCWNFVWSNSTIDKIWNFFGAIVMQTTNDGTNGNTLSVANAVICDHRQMSLGIKLDCLITIVITCHVTLATVDAELTIKESHHLLFVVYISVVANAT